MATCKSCGAEIIWKKTMDGKNMPLDAKPKKMVHIVFSNDGERAIVIDAYTPHWSTCPEADHFRRSKGDQR